MDFSRAVIVCAEPDSPLLKKTIQVLVEEVKERTGIHLLHAISEAGDPKQIIELKISKDINAAIEGFSLEVISSTPVRCLITGNDQRGLLYGIGYFLRKAMLTPGKIKWDGSLAHSSAPHNHLRGHQLGYRPLNNTYEAWTPEQFDKHIRELVLFGANSIEILPGGTDDDDIRAALSSEKHGTIPADWKDATGWPLMKSSFDEMMVRLSETIHSYGADTWLWWPNMGANYEDASCEASELEERNRIFKMIPHLDHLFIPGGDPGELTPELLFSWVGKLSKVLHKYHPNAGIWLSLQSFHQSDEWLNAFLAHASKKPSWLTGLVFSPWQRMTLPVLWEKVKDLYPIRHYPDIGHSINCQYPVPNWDKAFAMTHGREGFNPRPEAQKKIHNIHESFTIGSIGYSEGINDDVNKFIWLDQEWDPNRTVQETLTDYGRLFIGSDAATKISDGFISLEHNWEGDAVSNNSIENTLSHWKKLENELPDTSVSSYRFQMGLMRAYTDCWIRRRLLHETDAEKKALELLTQKGKSETTIQRVRDLLIQQVHDNELSEMRAYIDVIGEKIFRSVQAQISVAKYEALAWNRGAFLDTIDLPLNNKAWLLHELEKVESMKSEEERLKALKAIATREDPGPNGIYENFGVSGKKGRSVLLSGWEKDPGHLSTPFITHALALLHQSPAVFEKLGPVPLAWISNIHALYNTPIVLEYEVENKYAYELQITYLSNMFGPAKITLILNDTHTIHNDVVVENKVLCVKYPLPEKATKTGKLKFCWTTPSGYQGANIAELWIRKIN
ncbi:MAG: hypothetical protein JNL74_01610 [Fibrobacteres bacterium]|nr:hypothetical protein [Fibrobacterota bacterium]